MTLLKALSGSVDADSRASATATARGGGTYAIMMRRVWVRGSIRMMGVPSDVDLGREEGRGRAEKAENVELQTGDLTKLRKSWMLSWKLS